MFNTPIVVTLFVSAACSASTCQPRLVPISVDNVALSNTAEVRGAFLKVGTPSQNLSMLVSGTFNETYIYGTNGYCPSGFSDAACATYRGGRYSDSSSTKKAPASDKKVDYEVTASWESDTLALTSNLSLQNYEFGIPTKDFAGYRKAQAQLGLGRNSSLLATLKDSGQIAARAYSFFWGVANGATNQQTSGSLVLGGIDESFVPNYTTPSASKNLTLPLNFNNDACKTGLLVTINGIALNWLNGTNTNLINAGGQAFSACLIPEFVGLMTMSSTVWTKFQNSAGGKYLGSRDLSLNYLSMMYDAQGVFAGDLTLSFQASSTFNIRVPNSQFVLPPTSIDTSSGLIVTNNTVRDIAINQLTGDNTNDLPLLGRLFFTSAYLNVNHDAGTFTLWQANSTAGDSNLKVLDTQNQVLSGQDACSQDNGTSRTSGGTPTATPLFNANHTSKRLSTAGIAGIVVGVVGGIALLGTIIGVALVYSRRRRRRSAELGVGTPPVPPYNSKPGFGIYAMEMQGEAHPLELPSLHASELPGSGPVEMDAAHSHKEAIVGKLSRS